MLDSTLHPIAENTTASSIKSTFRLTTDSLVNTWRSKSGGRLDYETRTSYGLALKLQCPKVGPNLRQQLRAMDAAGSGTVQQHVLQHVLMVHFGVLLGAAELECLKAEWQVLDPLTQLVDYERLCELCSPEALDPAATTPLTLHSSWVPMPFKGQRY
ncbi:hypothetical protein QJQ45_025254 [Haematococcus lacustris]|nr:hypothetical protein QJQ45_025254 [Haematococcus lacustris]